MKGIAQSCRGFKGLVVCFGGPWRLLQVLPHSCCPRQQSLVSQRAIDGMVAAAAARALTLRLTDITPGDPSGEARVQGSLC